MVIVRGVRLSSERLPATQGFLGVGLVVEYAGGRVGEGLRTRLGGSLNDGGLEQ